MEERKKRVVYFYDEDVGNYYYGHLHPMKPHRIRMAHNLICAYDLYPKLQVYKPKKASVEELCKFHTPEYIQFLQLATPENIQNTTGLFNINDDSTVFDGLIHNLYSDSHLEKHPIISCSSFLSL